MSRRLRIELTSHDPEIVDGTTRKIAKRIGDWHSYPPVAIPLPARSEQVGDEVPQRVHPRVIEVRAATTDLVARMQQLNLPEGVEVAIKQTD
jgi:ribosomal protein S10